MKKNVCLVMLFAAIMISCTKEKNEITANSSEFSKDNNDVLSTNRTPSTRSLIWVGSGPGELEPDCVSGKGNCLPTFEVVGKALYEGFISSVKSDNQIEFFSKVNYLDVFNNNELNQIEASHQIQDALEKGHLKFKIESTSTIDYCLVIKPQHEHFDPALLANKVVVAIPVYK